MVIVVFAAGLKCVIPRCSIAVRSWLGASNMPSLQGMRLWTQELRTEVTSSASQLADARGAAAELRAQLADVTRAAEAGVQAAEEAAAVQRQLDEVMLSHDAMAQSRERALAQVPGSLLAASDDDTLSMSQILLSVSAIHNDASTVLPGRRSAFVCNYTISRSGSQDVHGRVYCAWEPDAILTR